MVNALDINMEDVANVIDGGWGWVVVFASFYVVAIKAAVVRCYSVFYTPLMLEFSLDYASVAWLNASEQLGYAVASKCFCYSTCIIILKLLVEHLLFGQFFISFSINILPLIKFFNDVKVYVI